MRNSTQHQFLKDAQYWIEVEHRDVCAFCRDGGQHCASAPKNASKQRTRVAQFVYFMEAIDYAQHCAKLGVQVWLRKPRYVGCKGITIERIESEYSHYPAVKAVAA